MTGEGLPVAVLPYCGRPLLESLIRDVQAREFLYYKLHGVQQMTPIAIMTSDAKDNHRRVTDFIADCDWFGRGKDSFRCGFDYISLTTLKSQSSVSILLHKPVPTAQERES